MSNSYKKVCAGGNATGSNHEWYKDEHRRERRTTKQVLNTFLDETLLPHPKQYCNPWLSPTDGKRIYWGNFEIKKDHFSEDTKLLYIKYMRK